MFISRMRLTVCTYCVVATAVQAVYIAVTFQCCLSANWPASPCVLCINLSSSILQVVRLLPDRCDTTARGWEMRSLPKSLTQFGVLYGWWWEWNSASYLVIAVPVLLSSCLGVCFL